MFFPRSAGQLAGLNYQAMGRIFSGLAQTGSWGCFDEFNRIEPSVLSVVSMQIKTIQTAMNLGRETFDFDSRTIELDMKMGVFITMNPGALLVALTCLRTLLDTFAW